MSPSSRVERSATITVAEVSVKAPGCGVSRTGRGMTAKPESSARASTTVASIGDLLAPRPSRHVFQQIPRQEREQMYCRPATLANAVAAVRVLHEVDLLAQLDQPVEQSLGALVVDVVVPRTVHQQQPAAQPLGMVDGRRGLVTRRVFLREAHVALLVDG